MTNTYEKHLVALQNADLSWEASKAILDAITELSRVKPHAECAAAKACDVLENGRWWEYLADNIPEDAKEELHSALDMAISALRQQAAEAHSNYKDIDKIEPGDVILWEDCRYYVLAAHHVLSKESDKYITGCISTRACDANGTPLNGKNIIFERSDFASKGFCVELAPKLPREEK